MKKVLLVSLLFFVSCGHQTIPIDSSQEKNNSMKEKQIIEDVVKENPIYRIEEKASEASCIDYMVTKNGEELLEVSEGLLEAMECTAVVPSVHPTLPFVVYFDYNSNQIRQFVFETFEENVLLELREDLDGFIFHGWSPDELSLLFTTMSYDDPEYVAELTRLNILNFGGEEYLDSESYDVKVSFVCGSSQCVPGPEEVKWMSNAVIQYLPWDEVPYDRVDAAMFKRAIVE